MSVPSGFVIEAPVGRLVLTRAVKVRSVEEAGDVRNAVSVVIHERPHGAVVCTDWRDVDVFAPEVADVLLAMFRGTNPWVVRGAILLPGGHATFGLQLERMLREANNPARRAFRDPRVMLTWLAEILTAEETRHAEEFLGLGA